ncbi:hypothetical protein M5K25_009750 [Dendrobium thyrsiflorum]|uniref:Uncharacterized protein n=1 Tax=Dendrobium thyrsiflorum TaxID=117978 RepID=A0ABD0V6D5_DENTH
MNMFVGPAGPQTAGDEGWKDCCLATEVRRTVVGEGGHKDHFRWSGESLGLLEGRVNNQHHLEAGGKYGVTWRPGGSPASLGGRAEIRRYLEAKGNRGLPLALYRRHPLLRPRAPLYKKEHSFMQEILRPIEIRSLLMTEVGEKCSQWKEVRLIEYTKNVGPFLGCMSEPCSMTLTCVEEVERIYQGCRTFPRLYVRALLDDVNLCGRGR